MKKILIGMAALVASALPAFAAEVAYNQSLANQTVTSTSAFTLDLSAYGIDDISFQVSVASAIIQQQTFTDGKPSTGTITVVTNSFLSAQAASDTIKVANNSPLTATQGSISVQVSSAGPGPLTYSTLTVVGVPIYPGTASITVSSNAYAVWISTAINAVVPNVTASVANGGSTVTITCVNAGVFCNSYTIKSSTVALQIVDSTATYTLGPSNFYNGSDNASFTINGSVYPQGTIWTKMDVSSNTAISIMNGVNALGLYTASTVTTTSVLIKLNSTGSAGNSYTLTSSTGSLSILSPTFQGGQDSAFLNIDGRIIVPTVGASASITATNIQNQINADPVLSTVLVATAPAGSSIVYATGSVVTSGNNNYYWSSSSQAALSVSNTGLYGGTTSGYLVNTPTIVIPNHGYATGEEVKFTSGTINISGLTNQTSYYVIMVDANDIQLAVASTSAFAGTGIVLASSATSGGHTFTLTPLALSGVIPVTWSVSNDNVTYSTPTVTNTGVSIPLNTLSTPWAPTSWTYDLGSINYRYLRLTVGGPNPVGNGAVQLLATGYGKRYWR